MDADGREPVVVVCVGWRAGNAVREANWVEAKAWYEGFGLPVVTADSEVDQPFNLPAAINRAVAAAPPDWDVIVVSDADTLLAQEALVSAIESAWITGSLVHPVTRYWRQAEDGSWPDSPETFHAGGVHVWGRAAWKVLDGYDERFVGWGGHDTAALFAALTYSLYREVDGDAWHLWHGSPESEAWWTAGVADWPDATTVLGDSAPPGYGASGPRPMHPLARRYSDALHDTVAMRALLAERFPGGQG
jgi:hypothetical protein